MKLREALQAAEAPANGPLFRVHLCCGFEPLHLRTFIKAHLRLRLAPADGSPARPVEVATGLFGDLAGNIERALAGGGADPIIAVVDWSDVDLRLGLREGYAPTRDDHVHIVADAGTRLGFLESLLARAVKERRALLVLPFSPLPPWLPGLPGQLSLQELELRTLLAGFAARCAAQGVLVASPAGPDAYDIRAHVNSGFPLALTHADLAGASIASLLVPVVPKKGLITDLDNTFWKGILGDDGPANVHWSLDEQARLHGLYQQLLASLHAQGVLLAVASKNDAQLVTEVFGRPDFLFKVNEFFPVEANWGAKSDSIRRIASQWNIGLDAIVFVDDSPLEIAEVQQALPEVECHLFPSADPVAGLELLRKLRDRFARERISDEDRLRSASIRNSAEIREAAAHADPEALLETLQASTTNDFNTAEFDARAFELLNKTNQFNLNGGRWEEGAYRDHLARPGALLCVTSYEDRYGKLGKIGVATGQLDGGTLRLDSWVLSCRAFSRRIEFCVLRGLFERTAAREIRLKWQSTPRNGPTRDALAVLFDDVPESGELVLTRAAFESRCPKIHSRILAEPPS